MTCVLDAKHAAGYPDTVPRCGERPCRKCPVSLAREIAYRKLLISGNDVVGDEGLQPLRRIERALKDHYRLNEVPPDLVTRLREAQDKATELGDLTAFLVASINLAAGPQE